MKTLATKVRRSEGIEADALDDSDVMDALVARDHRRALSLLMTMHGDLIYGYALRLTCDPQLACEVRMSVFEQAYRHLERLAGHRDLESLRRSSVQTWLLGIARHCCLDTMKAGGIIANSVSKIGISTQIERPPLLVLDSVVRFLWTRKTYDRVFKPIRADIIQEWQNAHIAGEVRRARYIKHVFGRLIMLNHVAAQLPLSIFKFFSRFFEVSK